MWVNIASYSAGRRRASLVYASPTAASTSRAPAARGPVAADPSVTALRDATFGVVGLALLLFVGARAEAWYMLAVAPAPLGDTLIVLRHGGTAAPGPWRSGSTSPRRSLY
jgi:hypothetical protein